MAFPQKETLDPEEVERFFSSIPTAAWWFSTAESSGSIS